MVPNVGGNVDRDFKCVFCHNEVIHDAIALNKKLIGRSTRKFMCLHCLADYLFCTEDDLLTQIIDWKQQGCSLFN